MKKEYCYCVQWKDSADHSKGTLWTYMSTSAFKHAGVPRIEDGIHFMRSVHRPQLCMRGTKWQATWQDGTTFTIRSSPQATKPLMASIALRWANPPKMLQRDGGKPFELRSLKTNQDSFVYLVRLLTFQKTASGAAYFKIGKALSIPSRIKQFGPCELIAHQVLGSDAEALKREKELHQQLAVYRQPETEIFLFKPEELQRVVGLMQGNDSGRSLMA